jgi:hypothetical protein
MERITNAQLETMVRRINESTGSPLEPYTKTETGCRANVGNYHLSGAYGGKSLHRMCSEGGGVSDVFGCGHIPARDLYNRMRAFLDGLHHNGRK